MTCARQKDDRSTWCPGGACRGCDTMRVLVAMREMLRDLEAQGVPPETVLRVAAIDTLTFINRTNPDGARAIITSALHAQEQPGNNTLN